MSLPDAKEQNPACGCCGDETQSDGDGFTCEDCQLWFSYGDLTASFLNPETPVCGDACDNSWHGDNKIWPGKGHNCGTCQLPVGHTSFHWRNCQTIDLTTELDAAMDRHPAGKQR